MRGAAAKLLWMKLGLPETQPADSCQIAPGRPAPRRGEPRPGDVLDGRFAIIHLISRGGMAVVFRAEDLQNDNQAVALKIPYERVEMDLALFSRFQREEEIGRQLDHPYILRFVEAANKSRPYVVTEFLTGKTLFDVLRESRKLPEPQALALASRICEALASMHDQGVHHRDLKPENIMLCDDGSIRIMDFGIARAADSRRLTFMGFAPGTPHYMAPERVQGKRGDARTDLYTLGAILYEMLTGVIAFHDEDPQVIMQVRALGDPEAPRKVNPAISPAAEEIVLHAMERDPARRYATAAAMRADLDCPSQIKSTGRHLRLKAVTRWTRLARKLRTVVLWVLVPIALQILAFLILWRHLSKK
jgi:serine/threonine-protein kinase